MLDKLVDWDLGDELPQIAEVLSEDESLWHVLRRAYPSVALRFQQNKNEAERRYQARLAADRIARQHPPAAMRTLDRFWFWFRQTVVPGRLHQNEVLDPIVRLLAVQVMDDFARRQHPAQVLGHH